MKTLRLLARDMRGGMLQRWYLLVIPVLFAAARAGELHHLINQMAELNILYTEGTAADYVMYVMQGTPVFNFDPKEYFSIPIYWFAFQMWLAYLLEYYSYDDFTENGRVLLIASGSRKSWWMGKFIYCMLSVAVYFAVGYLAVCVAAGFYGADMSFHVTKSLAAELYPSAVVSLGSFDVLLLSVILPVLISMAVSAVQVLVGFLVNPVVSFAGVCALYVLSAYYTAWYFVGNYTMWQRMSYVVEDGISPESGLAVAGGLLVITMASGMMYFENKDVM